MVCKYVRLRQSSHACRQRSRVPFIEGALHRGCPSSRVPFFEVALLRGCPSSRLPFFEVVHVHAHAHLPPPVAPCEHPESARVCLCVFGNCPSPDTKSTRLPIGPRPSAPASGLHEHLSILTMPAGPLPRPLATPCPPVGCAQPTAVRVQGRLQRLHQSA